MHLYLLMPNLHRRSPPSPRDDGYLTCYGIVVACASLLLLSVLAATVSFGKACATAGAVGVFLGAVGCVSRMCSAHIGGATGAPAVGLLPTTTVRPAVCATCGLVDAAIDALPAFAYARPATEGGGGSKSGRCALCPVCLEDVQTGEMVRQLPACRHLFHVECIDMWLHSHKTCPLCRCDVSPQPVTVKATAAAAAAAVQLPADDALPPV